MKKNTSISQLPIYVISPHLDDAIFSLGSTLATLSPTNKITVINVFTKADESHTTISAKAFLNQSGINNPTLLFKQRLKEDKKVMQKLGIKVHYLSYIDALWRRLSKKSYRYLPAEFNSIYPTYRWHVSKGKIASADSHTLHRLIQDLYNLLPKHGEYLVYVPLGYGGHVDHVLVRKACETILKPQQIVYYLEFPYSVRKGVVKATCPPGYFARSTPTQYQQKLGLCQQYLSQYQQVIPHPQLLTTPETTYHFRQLVRPPSLSLRTHFFSLLASPKAYLYDLIKTGSSLNEPVNIMPYQDKDLQILNSFLKKLQKNIAPFPPQAIGSTPLKIAGQRDLDILIPINRTSYHVAIDQLSQCYGMPTHQTPTMTQWKLNYSGLLVDLDLIVIESQRYQEQSYRSELLATNNLAKRIYETWKIRQHGSTKRQYSLAKILFLHNLKKDYPLLTQPRRLGGNWQLTQVIEGDSLYPSNYLFGTYKNLLTGKQAFAKILISNQRNRAYQSLRNEQKVYNQLGGKTIGKTKIPYLYESSLNHTCSYLLIEPIRGNQLKALPRKSQLRLYNQTLKSLSQLSKMDIAAEYRPPIYWVAISLGLIVYHTLFPSKLSRSQLMQITRYLLTDFPHLLARRTLSFVHRDLNLDNIIVSADNNYLIDYQLACIADPILECSVIYLKHYTTPQLITKLPTLSSWLNRVNDPVTKSVFRGYLIILGLYDLLLPDGRHTVTTKMFNTLITQKGNNI